MRTVFASFSAFLERPRPSFLRLGVWIVGILFVAERIFELVFHPEFRDLFSWTRWLLMAAIATRWAHLERHALEQRDYRSVLNHLEAARIQGGSDGFEKVSDCIVPILKNRNEDIDWNDFEEGIANLLRMKNQDVTSTVFKFISELAVAPEAEEVFRQSLTSLGERMRYLKEGVVIEEVTHREQYLYAKGIGDYHHKFSEGTLSVYATAFDAPSKLFMRNPEYFTSQMRPGNRNDIGFRSFVECERALVGVPTKESTARSSTAIPVAARLVIAAEERLASYKRTASFWKFCEWHFQNGFGLKFLLPEALPENENYEAVLSRLVMEPEDVTVDDFICYGSSCVFGRLDPAPLGDDKKVRLRMVIDQEKVGLYRAAFETLWNWPEATLSVAQLLSKPSFVQDENIRDYLPRFRELVQA